MDHLTVASFPEKLWFEFSSGDTVDIDMDEIGRRFIPSRYLSNSHFPLSFLDTLIFLPPLSHLVIEAPPPLLPWINLF